MKTENEYKTDEKELINKIIAYKPITNCIGLGIINIINDNDDYIQYASITDNEVIKKYNKSKVRYNCKGLAYFIDFNGHRQYLSDFIRIEY